MLIENTLYGIKDKVKIVIDRIREFEPPDGYYVAFSGGKDSIVTLDLVKKAGVKYEAHYNLTTVDPPELVNFIRDNYKARGRYARIRERKKGFKIMKQPVDRFRLLEIKVHRPEMSMWQLIPKKRMPPTRRVRYCCEILKEGGGIGRCVMTGVRWQESTKRANRRMVESCLKGGGKTYLHPIIDWSKEEVWEYIQLQKLLYCSLYDEGKERLGCVMCPMMGDKGMKKEAERWPEYKTAYIRAFDKMIELRIKDGLKTTWKTGEEVFDWWVNSSKKHGKENPDQTVIFE